MDEYEVEVAAASLMTVTMVAVGERADDFDTYLYVTGPSGTQLSNDDAEISNEDGEYVYGSQLTVIVPKGGSWRIEATALSQEYTGTYRLSVETRQLKRLSSDQGEIDESDDKLLKGGEYFDTYKFQVVAERTYAVLAASVELDPFLSVHYPGGLMTNDDAPGSYEKLLAIIRPTGDGEATVIMTSNSAEEAGRYRVMVVEAAEAE